MNKPISRRIRLSTRSTKVVAASRPFAQWQLQALEDRLTPANVPNILANTPEANQATLTSAFTQSETGTIAFGNTIVTAFNDSGSDASGNRFTGYARSTDGGATFTDLGVLSASNDDGGDPVLTRNETTGRIYLTTLSGVSGTTLKVFRSDDNGLTFTAAVNAFNTTGASYDKQWITVDNFAGVGNGNVYLITRDFGAASGIVFTRSTDNGNTWSPPVTVVTLGSTNVQGANIVVNSDHSLTAFWFESTAVQTIRASRSTDFGATWGAAVTVGTLGTTGVNGNLVLTRSNTNSSSFRSNTFPQVAANPVVPGVIYAVFADDGPGADKANIRFSQSNNNGLTWSAPVIVNADGGTNDQFMPSLRVSPDGTRLSVGWYDRRLDSANALIDYFARGATISGTTTTFGVETRITNAPFLPDFGRDGLINSTYMGDYDQGAAVGSKFIYTWSDNRLGGPDIRIATTTNNAIGAQIFNSTPTGVVTSFSGNIDINFNQAMDPTSFSPASDIVSFLRDGSVDVASSITGFSWINSNRTLRIVTNASVGGNYVLTLGTNILTATGQAIDDDLNGTPGELADQYATAFTLPSPRILTATPTGVTTAPVSTATFNFSSPMDTGSFAVIDDVFSFSGPSGNLITAVTGFTWVTNTQLQIAFSSQTLPGVYSLVLNPTILNTGGGPLDNDNDGTPNEIPGDRFTLGFTIPSPRITSSTPTGTVVAPVTSAVLNFNAAMNTGSFDVASDVFSFTGPAGNLVPIISGFTWITNQQLQINFDAQLLTGAYSLVLNPSILSTGGFPLDNDNDGTPNEIPGDRYTVAFTIGAGGGGTPNAFGYRFAATPLDNSFNIQPTDAFVNTLTNSSNTDDDFDAISLGANTFNYYGTTYTSLFASSNGVLSFVSGSSAYSNTNLATSPSQAFIAALWDDLHTGRNTTPTNDLVLTRILNNQLVVNWRNVHYIGGTSTENGISFQIILQLNTGAAPGTITYNYTDLDDGGTSSQNNAASATIGIKNIGTTAATGDPLLVGFNGTNPTLVASGKAVRIFKNSAPTAVANGPYTVASGGTVVLSSTGTTDPDGDTLTYLWDLDGDGTFGETGAGALRGIETGASPTFNAVGAAAGPYPVALRVFDPSGEQGNAMATVNVTGGAAAAKIASVLFNGSADGQRSMARSLVVTFDSIVTLPPNPASAFNLEKLGVGGGNVLLAATVTNSGVTVVTLTFSGAFTEGAGAFYTDPSLVDGRYRLTADATQINSGNFDGDGNGTAGDNYVIGNQTTDNFFRLYGDINGDSSVDGSDLSFFGNDFSSASIACDFNGDGTVDGSDLAVFGNSFGLSI